MSNTVATAAASGDDIHAERLLVGAAEVGRLLGLSGRTIWRKNAGRQIPGPVRVGGTPRWNVEELKAWIRAGCPRRDQWEAVRKAGR